MRGLMGNRLLKRFVGDIRHKPIFGVPGILDSRPDEGEGTTNSLETIEEKAQTRTPELGGEATDEIAGISHAGENSMNGNA